MDDLLRQTLCSIGITYLVIRFGRSATSLIAHLLHHKGDAAGEHRLDPDRW